MTDQTNLPNLSALPNLAQLEAFVMNADAVLAPFASIPQVAFVHQIVVPLLEGALTIGTQVQAQAGAGNMDPLKQFLAQELAKLGAVFQPHQ
jgi:hypothetical protein